MAFDHQGRSLWRSAELLSLSRGIWISKLESPEIASFAMPQSSGPLDTVLPQLMPGPEQSWNPREGAPLPIVVLASGNGSNLQKIIDKFERSRLVEVCGVASNHANAKALQRAKERDLPTAVFERGAFRDRLARDERMGKWIEDRGAKLVVSAGYLEILSPAFVEKFQGRIINIHPSRLPDYPGLNAIKRAYDEGKRRNGITIHFVDDGVDTGPQIKTKTVLRYPWDSLEKFEARVHAKEHKHLPKVIRNIALGKIKLGSRPRDGLVKENQAERLSRYLHAVAAAPGAVLAFFSSGPSGGTARAGHH